MNRAVAWRKDMEVKLFGDFRYSAHNPDPDLAAASAPAGAPGSGPGPGRGDTTSHVAASPRLTAAETGSETNIPCSCAAISSPGREMFFARHPWQL